MVRRPDQTPRFTSRNSGRSYLWYKSEAKEAQERQPMTNIFREQYAIDQVSCQIPSLPEIYFDHFGNLTNGTFVEVGAFDCHNWSNTFMLAELGFHGLYMEPHPEYFSKCLERYKDHPRIQLANLAVGNQSGTTKLFTGGSLTTIKEESVAAYNEISWARSSGLDLEVFIECEIERLDTVLERFEISPGFEVLVIDVEGAEEDVLNGFSVNKWRPTMVIIETHEKLPERSLNWKAKMSDYFFIEQNGYRKIHADSINSIYVKSKFYLP